MIRTKILHPTKCLTQLLASAVEKAFPNNEGKAVVTFGKKGADYQSPVLLSQAFNKVPLQNISELFLQNLPANDAVSKIYTSPNKFLNIILREDWISKRIVDIAEEPWAERDEKKRAVVDYASPNMAKELHVGHMRSIVQGEFISRLLEKVGGYNVTRISHVGDFGTPLANLIAHFIEIEKTENYDINSLTPAQLSEHYKTSVTKAKTDASFAEKGAKINLLLQNFSDKKVKTIWEKICATSRAENDKIYNWFSINPIECGEAFYNQQLPGIVEELEHKGLIQLSDGAKCIFFDGEKTPMIVQKNNAGYLYSTTDLAALKHRIFNLHANKIVYLTDAAQQLHFQQVFQVGKKMGWCENVSLHHAYFGPVLGDAGTRIKSREGTSYKLVDFLQQAEQKANEALQNSAFNRGQTDIKLIAQAAVKYYELANVRTQEYKFIFDKMTSFYGNTGVYLLYAYSRIISIIEKYYGTTFNDNLLSLDPTISISLNHPTERALGIQLISFWDVLDYSLTNLTAHTICDFMYELASRFSTFYEMCPILTDAEGKASKIELCKATGLLLKKGFEILNIVTTRL